MITIQSALQSISNGNTLSASDMESVMIQMMQGELTEAQIGALFMGLAQRGETVDEITGAVKAVRAMASTIQGPEDCVDCCGTGGDQASTYNISTAVSFVTAACGVPVAKHGNRSATSKSGAADVLEALGINLNAKEPVLLSSLNDLNFCFLMAPNHHEALKHAKKVRSEIGIRTIANLLGPLANPANTIYQLIGVFDKKWLEPMAQVLKNLGTERAWIVHGSDGLDEVTLTGPTHVAALNEGVIKSFTVSPEDFGLHTIDMESIRGGDAQTNAKALISILKDKPDYEDYKSIVIANTACILHIHNPDLSLRQASMKAREAIASGAALKILESYKTITNQS